MRLVASSHESEFNNYPEMIIFHKEVFSVYTEGVELPEFLFLQCGSYPAALMGCMCRFFLSSRAVGKMVL